MKKLSKATLKRFESINWDCKDFLTHPINIKFSNMRTTFSDEVAIFDFFCSESDKNPLFSLITKTKIKENLLSYGRGKNTVYKKLRSADCEWELERVNTTYHEINRTIPIGQIISVNLT